MTYADLKLIINQAYATFASNYIVRKRLGASDKYSLKNVFLVKVIYKVLMNQEGDETKDSLTKEQIQDIIKLFNKYSNSTVQIESSIGLDILGITVGDTAPNVVLIYFNSNIDTFSVPNIADFTITFSGGAVIVTTITIPVDGFGNSTIIEIGLNRGIASGEIGELTYTEGVPPIISLDEGESIGSFSDYDITNNV